jgi:hypothetical protein
MLCWTERGTFTFTRSLLLAAARVLIKVSTPLSVEAVIAEVFSDIFAISGKQELSLDDRPKELLKGHAVVIKKARHGSGRSQDDTEPACSFLADHITQKQIRACGNADGKDRAEELTDRQAKENAFLVLPDLFGDFNFFDGYYLQFVRKFDRYLRLRDNISRKMFGKELAKMSMIQQLLIVAGALIALPFVVKLLWRLYLFPLGCWLVATRLFWPKWATANDKLCLALLGVSVLFFLGAWGLRYAAKKRREKEWLDHVLATAPVLDYGQIAFHGETD